MMFMVPPVFLVLIELGLLFIVTTSFWYWLFKIKTLKDLLNEPVFTWISTALLIASNAWFIIEIILLAIGDSAAVEHYFMISLGLFCFTSPIYLNQKVINKNKTLLVGTGVMGCAIAGGFYCVMSPLAFAGSQFTAVQAFLIVGQFFLQLVGISQETPIQMY